MALKKELIHIDSSDFDPGLIPPIRVNRSSFECVHTPCPEGYIQWHAWATRASKTHAQIKCQLCGLWAIWLPEAEAKVINKADRKAEKEAVQSYEKFWSERELSGKEQGS